ncbi:MAG: NAD(+) diphosphatase [Microcella sp.]|uniref:NAD(+) diphosphatase n=1 Tax=Microcella sp. TaxID=1913979 RepID=UPI003315C0E2
MHRSLTAQLPLSRYRIDRDHLTRERPRLFDELWADPRTRVIALWRGEVLIAENDEAPALEYLTTEVVPDGLLRIYLGRALDSDPALPAGSPIVAAVFDDESAKELQVDIARWRSPRTLGHRLGDRDAGLAIEALGIANWHETHLFSPRTGHSTSPAKGGWVRIDDEDGQEMFPRTDAAIIVGITDTQDRLVLGSNALWESNRFSLLAGFVEPGESLEAAVVREVFEETGLRIVDPHYVGSQPWPFPASLMLGFRATLDVDAENVLRPDGTEILDLRWFTRDDLAANVDSILLPGRTSIARAIIEDWFGGPLEDP